MELTLTAKVQGYPTPEQERLLERTLEAYRQGCHWVSGIVDATHGLQQAVLHTETDHPLRTQFVLRSQMAQSVIKTVIARYKTVLANGHPWTQVRFTKPALDLVWNRDYSLKAGWFSLNTLTGRVPVPFARQGMERFFDGTWQFGTAHLVYRHGRWFRHVLMTKDLPERDRAEIRQVVGLDFGIYFVVTAYDSQGQTTFVPGRAVKVRRAHFKMLRRDLQRRQTPSARRRDRYTPVSWAFYQRRQMLEYKAVLHQARVVAVDPRYTSQICPKWGHVARGNRDKRRHRFACQQCHYRSNDDRIGAMNLHRRGIEYRVTGAIAAGPRS